MTTDIVTNIKNCTDEILISIDIFSIEVTDKEVITIRFLYNQIYVIVWKRQLQRTVGSKNLFNRKIKIMQNSRPGQRNNRHRLATVDELNKLCRQSKKKIPKELQDTENEYNLRKLTKVYFKTVWKETKSRICRWCRYCPMVPSLRGIENWEVMCAKVQQSFDDKVDALLHKMIEENFETIINEHIKSPFKNKICTEDLLNRIACRLLEDSTERYKKLIPLIKAPKCHIKEQPFKGQVVYNQIYGIYRQTPNFDAPFFSPVKPLVNMTSSNAQVFNIIKEKEQQRLKHDIEKKLMLSKQKSTIVQQEELNIKIHWDMDLIEPSTKFVLESEATKALKLPKRGKQRLSRQYLHLLRYKIDMKDRQWLQENKIIEEDRKKPTRIMLFLRKQIAKLKEDNECYRECDLTEMKSFTIPDFMLRKIQLYIVRVQIRSNGYITTVKPKPKPKPSSSATTIGEQIDGSPSTSSRLNNRMICRTHAGVSILTAELSKGNMQNSSHLIFGALLNNPLAMSRHSYSRLYLPTINRVHALP